MTLLTANVHKKSIPLLATFIIAFILLLSSSSSAERWDYNPFTWKLDKVLDKAEEISVIDVMGYFVDAGSPATVESALELLGASFPTVDSLYLRLDCSNDPLTDDLQILGSLDVEVSSGGAATIGSSTNLATGDYAVAMGDGAWATGDYSLAMGDGTLASGVGSIGMGDGSGATGDYSIGIGLGSTAIGDYSIAVGRGSTADEDYTVAMGYGSTADGENAIAMGYGSTATGVSSVAIGEGNSVLDDYATGIGYYVTADGESSVALGFITTASGDYSTAMGDVTYANGEASTAMGSETEANGLVSTAMGKDINVDGDYSFGISLNDPVSDYEVVPNNVMAIMGGRVGIGIASPVQVLHVVGNILTSNTASTAVVDTQYIENTAGGALTVRDDLIVTGTINTYGLSLNSVEVWVESGTAIQTTIDAISDASSSKPYTVRVPPGVYTEQITLKDYVSLKGAGMYATKITNEGDAGDDFTTIFPADQVTISDMTVEATGVGISISNYGQAGLANDTFCVKNVYLDATFDLIASNQTGVTVYVFDVIGTTAYDGFVILVSGTTNKFYIYNTRITTTNSAATTFGLFRITTTDGEMYVYNSVIDGDISSDHTQYMFYSTGIMRIFDTYVVVDHSSDSHNIFGVTAAGASADVEVYGGLVKVTNSGAGSSTDLWQSGGTLNVYGTSYSNSTGTIGGYGMDDSDFIFTGGDVGIGTDTPLAKLHIVDSTVSGIRLSSTEIDDAIKYGIILNSSYDTSAEPEGFVVFGSTGGFTVNNVNIGGGNANRNAATQLSFYTAANVTTRTGTERMTIDSSGNIGINDTEPDYRLEILDGTNPQLALTNTDAIDYATFDVDTDGQLDITTVDGGGTGGHICLMPDGNVGIGTTTPGQLLEVGTFDQTNSTIKTGSLEFQPYSLNNGFIAENCYYNAGWKYRATGYAGLFYFNTGEGQFRFFDTGTGGDPLPGATAGAATQFKVNYDGSVALGGTINQTPGNYTGAEFFINGTSGDIGAGTVTPGADFHINHAVNETVNFFSGGVVGVETLQMGYIFGGASYITTDGTRSLALNTGGGNVGIGITTPTELLDVRGNIIASGATVESTWFDDGLPKIHLDTDDNSWFNTGSNVGIGTDVPTERLDVAGDITGGTNRVTYKNTIDLSSRSDFYAIDFKLADSDITGNIFRSVIADIKGTSDTFLQLMAPTDGYGYIESAGNSTGLCIGTEDNTDPIIFRPGRVDYSTMLPDGTFGVGTMTPDKLIHINSAATPTDSQLILQANMLGGVAFMTYAADNSAITFDAEWESTSWDSLDAGSNWRLYKNNDKLTIDYDTGIALGANIPWHTGLTMNNSGDVGIGVAPAAILDVSDGTARSGAHPTNLALYVTGNFAPGTPGAVGVEFRHANASQGVGFGYNTIYATGTSANVVLNLKSKGTSPMTLNVNTSNIGAGDATPDAKFEILSATAPQFKISHTDTIDDVDFSIDANGDFLTQISGDNYVIQNDVDGITGFQVNDADGGNPVFNVDTANEWIGIRQPAPAGHLHSFADTGDVSYLISLENDNSDEYESHKIVFSEDDASQGAEVTSMRFSVLNGGGYNELLTLKGIHSGFLDADPDATLEVVGDFMISAAAGGDGDVVTVDTNGKVFLREEIRTFTSIYRRYYHLDLASFDPGASGAVWTAAGANTVGGWQLDHVDDVLETKVDVHADWDGESDLTVECRFQINAASAENNTVDITAVFYYMGLTETGTKTQTITGSTNVGLGGAKAQFTMFSQDIVLPYDTGGQEVDAGDCIAIQLYLNTGASEVDDIILNAVTYYYDTTHIGIESGDT